ncbi:MAG: hypothetical protein EBU08_18835 [Micrococcales bacterium]|nr:hypothetical protein [Micrococcales bacterium]
MALEEYTIVVAEDRPGSRIHMGLAVEEVEQQSWVEPGDFPTQQCGILDSEQYDECDTNNLVFQ